MKASHALRAGCLALCAVLAVTLAGGCALLPQASAPSASAPAEPPLYNSVPLEDGALRILSPQDPSLGATVLCGGSVLCQGKPTDTLSLVQDEATGETNYYLRAWSDPDTPTGRRSALYDKQGAPVLEFSYEASVFLHGGLLAVSRNGSAVDEYDAMMPGHLVRVVELATGARLPIPEQAYSCAFAGDVVAFNCYALPEGLANIWEDPYPFQNSWVRVEDLAGNLLLEELGCVANSLSPLYGNADIPLDWLELNYYPAAEGGAYSVFYDPATGVRLEGSPRMCGGTLACVQVEDGRFDLIDLAKPELPVVDSFDAQVLYSIPGVAVLRRETEYSYYELHDLTTGEVLPLSAMTRNEDVLAAYALDGTLRSYDARTGALLTDLKTEPIQGQVRAYLSAVMPDGYLVLHPQDGNYNELAARLYGPEGLLYDSTAQNDGPEYAYLFYLTNTADGPLVGACYNGPAGARLYDVLDCRGNLLLHGLASCSAPYGGDYPPGCFVARRGYYYGWMDSTGEWLYCQSIFSTLDAEEGPSYRWY